MSGHDGSAPDLVLRYADHACGLLDLHLPGGEMPDAPTSVLLLVHGGFWRSAWDRGHTRPQARALADLGHVVVTTEYRRVGPGDDRDGAGGGWPTTGDDVRRALAALPAVLPWAPTRTTAVGHSAGGHLVLWLAATGAPLDHVVALAPVCDLREALRLDLGDGAAAALLAGADPADADPMVLLDDRPACTVTVVHGTRDDAVPVTLSRALAARHPWISCAEVDADHMALIDPTSSAWPVVVGAVGPG